jgi:hypothetical protein
MQQQHCCMILDMQENDMWSHGRFIGCFMVEKLIWQVYHPVMQAVLKLSPPTSSMYAVVNELNWIQNCHNFGDN